MSSRALNTSYSSSMYNQEMKPLDYLYGPWESIEQMMTELDVTLDEIEPGLTVGVIENGKVVEYWNPFEGIGFIKKVPVGTVAATLENYTEALEYATHKENVGNIVYVKNPERLEGVDEEFGSGLYWVTNLAELTFISSDIWYGEFPEGYYDYWKTDEILPVNIDGAAKVSDVYIFFKTEHLFVRKRIDHLDRHVHWMVSDLDPDPDTAEFVPVHDYEYIAKVENVNGKIQLIREDFDTSKMLMKGHDPKDEEVFIHVQGTNMGKYKNGDDIKNGDTLETVLKNLFTNVLVPTKTIDPTMKLTGIEEDLVFEVGSVGDFQLGVDFVDGKVQTYAGAGDTDEGLMVDAGCEYSVVYEVLRPGSEDFEEISENGLFEEELVEGDYTFRATVNYQNGTVFGETNFGEKTDLTVLGGSLTDEVSFKVRYKMWSVTTTDEITTDADYHFDSTEDFGDFEWFTSGEPFVKELKLKKGEGYYVLVPEGYEMLFNAHLSYYVSPVVGGTFEHVLPNEETLTYTLNYMLNPGVYTHLVINKKDE